MSDLPTVAIQHRAEAGLIKATYLWPYVQPSETYQVQADGMSIDLDARFPLRPARIVVPLDIIDAALEPLADYFGNTLARGFAAAPHMGLLTVKACLTRENRLAFASLQAGYPSTPEPIRQANIDQIAAIERALPTFTRGGYGGGEAERPAA